MPFDLELAWRRVRLDHRADRGFFVHPAEVLLVEHDIRPWLQQLADDLASPGYRADPAYLVDVPKGAAAVRPGSVLSLRDQVVYSALVSAMLSSMSTQFDWTGDAPDHSYRISNPTAPEWLERRFVGWTRFHDVSLELLHRSNYAAVTDVSGFYENIQHRILISDLQACGVDAALTQLLARCLARWSQVRGRGIPQGYSPSDILAKLYLIRIDQALREASFTHVRYSDDIRIFCESRSEARKAVLELQRWLRQRGLILQSKKTRILRSDEAQPIFTGIFPIISSLVSRYRTEVAEAVGLDPGYASPADLQGALEQTGIAPPTAMLRAAYQAYFDVPGREFQNSLFRYLLNRLGEARDGSVIDSAISYLDEHPEETEVILRYVERVGATDQADSLLVEFLTSPEAIYPYQHFQIVRWRCLRSEMPAPEFMTYVRRVERSPRTPTYLRSAARMFLSRFGSAADLDHLQESYASAASDLERSEIICATARLERSRRNAFYSDSRRDGPLVALAVQRCLNSSVLWEGVPPLS